MSDRPSGREPNKYGVKLVRGPFVRLPPHPGSVESLEDLPRVRSQVHGPVAVDLFCGAGGLSLGLAAAGYTVIAGIDHDEDALDTHRAYHPGLTANLDLADPDVVERVGRAFADLDLDLVAGGPPCQPFSRAGRSAMRDLVRRGVRPSRDMRKELWQSFLRIVVLAKPKAVLMENVPDMALDRDMWILRTLVDELEQLGYSVEERVVSTGEFGVPQYRHRLFVVALADGVSFEWPESDGTMVTVRNAIGDLPAVSGGWRPENGDDENDPVASGWTPYAGPSSSFQTEMRKSVLPNHGGRIYDHITRPVREDDAIAFEAMDPGTKYSDLPDELRRYRSDIFDDKYKRLDWNGLSRTIVAHIAKDGYWYIHPDQPRTITVREAARLQTFPDHIRFSGPPTAAFKQIGNAVPPRMAERLGLAIQKSLHDGRSEVLTTGQVAASLARWFESREGLAIPWLRADSRWQVLAAEMLLSRGTRAVVQQGWRLVAKLQTPGITEQRSQILELGMRSLGRERRVPALLEAATWFTEHPDAISEDAAVTALQSAPGVTPAIADLAVRVRPGADEDRDDPVLVTYGALRVASRFQGAAVDETKNKMSDGRLAVARMIGGDDDSHAAHLALFELAASLCVPGPPLCGQCPLLEHCDHAQRNGVQMALSVTNPATV